MFTELRKILTRYMRPYAGSFLLVIVLQIIATSMSLYIPTLNARIIDDGVTVGDTHYIWTTGLFMLLLAAIQMVAQISVPWAAGYTAMGMARDLRADIFNKVMTFSSKEVNAFGAPSLITRTTNDVQQIQQLIFMSCVMLVGAPITMLGGVIMAIREDFGMTWIILVAVIVLAAGIVMLATYMLPLYKMMQKRIDNVNRVLREQIIGIRVVRAFVQEKHEAQRFDDANSALTWTSLRVGRCMAFLFPFVTLVMNLSTIAVMWFGAHRIDQGHLQVGQLNAFISYLMQILMSSMMATFIIMILPRAAVCADRIREVLTTELSVHNPDAPADPASISTGVVEFHDVSFSYPGAEHPVLKHVSFVARPGQQTAIIGSTGSGKTTLVNLIPRLFDVTDGHVTIDGVDVRQCDMEALWSTIGMVPQKPYLFSGTIRTNLRYGKDDATDAEMWEALEVAQAKGFVEKKEGKLDSEISQGGTNVSGGQRQRLAIARALVKKPHIYLFDDSFSALDVATDKRLREALKPTTKDATTIVVAQRVSSIKDADTIIVLDNGMVVGSGTHEELLAENATYQEIVASQEGVNA